MVPEVLSRGCYRLAFWARPYSSTSRGLIVSSLCMRIRSWTIWFLTIATRLRGRPRSWGDTSTWLKEGSDTESEPPAPGLENEPAFQSVTGRTSTFPSFAPVSASDVALSEVMLSKQTFNRRFRRRDPGVENQPPGGAGVRTGSEPARESAEGGATVEDLISMKEV